MKLINVNDTNYNQILKEYKDKPIVFLFVSDTCPHCVTVEKFFIEIQKSEQFDNIDVFIINTNVSPKLAEKYEIRSLPTTFFINSNKQIGNYIIGATNVDEFLNYLSKLKKQLKTPKETPKKQIKIIKSIFDKIKGWF